MIRMKLRLLPAWPRLVLGLIGVLTAILAPFAAAATRPDGDASDRTTLADSITPVAASTHDPFGRPNRTFVNRTALTVDEGDVSMRFHVALRLRRFEELQARVARGELIPRAELEARYLPLPADHDRVVRWLETEGFTITRTDDTRLGIFARGPVARLAQSFRTTFARITADGVDYTSAITAPSVPSSLARALRGIHGLQPHQRPRRSQPAALTPLASAGGSVPYYPSQIAQAYGSAALKLDGRGQTIAVYALGFPKIEDLATFWSTTGVPATRGNVEFINVAGGPASTTTSTSLQEATLDVEWASGMAPGAVIRVYGANENDPVGDTELIQQVLADLPSVPSLHQLTISYGMDESAADRDYIAIEAQYMAALVSQGVTVFAASGDYGALDNTRTRVGTGFPASMPDVTAVGGTSLLLDVNNNVASEVAWGNPTNRGTTGASGGGISAVFNRPAWQTGPGVPAGNQRLLPDVAAVGDPATGGFVVFNGKNSQIGGTSLSSPIWAAWCALINQSRSVEGKTPLGALNPRIYKLMGTAAFRDITTGGNSVYQAGPGYDLTTGIGVPNVAALLATLNDDNFAPTIEIQSGDRFTTVGQGATFYVVATAAPKANYRWQMQRAGSTSWSDLTESEHFRGTNNWMLTVVDSTVTMSGDRFRCVITNLIGTVTSAADALTVATSGVATLAGWPGWSGFADGQGPLARFNYTGSVRVDSAGTIYVADASNHTIRKITPQGLVTTFAGAPSVAGAVDGPGNKARFNGPAGVAIDRRGNVFVADARNYAIRRISPDGTVSTFAGSLGTRGRADGSGTAALFYDPQNLTIDDADTLYIADGAGNTVRKITPNGVVSTLAGSSTGAAGSADGIGAAARFYFPAGIAVDLAGNVYVGDYNNNSVRKITPAGVVTTLAGLAGSRNFGFVDATGSAARFDGPTGVAVDAAGNLFVADSYNDAIRLVTPEGVVTTLAGGTGVGENVDGPLLQAKFYSPSDVALDANGVLYVADSLNCTIRRITRAITAPPLIAVAPRSQTVAANTAATLAVASAGIGPFTYQWSRNGAPLTGATNATLALAANSPAATYTVAVTNASGTSVSPPALIAPANSGSSRLINLSVRTSAGTGAQTLTAGFVLAGQASQTLVVRAVGPGLAQFGLNGVLSDPILTVLGPDSSTRIAATNDNWDATLAPRVAAVGAFPLTAGSRDAVSVTTFSAGSYSAQITGANGVTGTALAEIYVAPPATDTRLINLSARAQVDAIAGLLIAGFTIDGDAPKTLLIRGIGPGLGQFGLTGFLANPRLDVFDGSSQRLQWNDDWGGLTALSEAFAAAGAFAPASVASRDAALLVTLPPGSYTAQVSGVAGSTGVALVEIYELKP
jgi:sugar lactone lactonase YvrE